jgi:hypothetical protein
MMKGTITRNRYPEDKTGDRTPDVIGVINKLKINDKVIASPTSSHRKNTTLIARETVQQMPISEDINFWPNRGGSKSGPVHLDRKGWEACSRAEFPRVVEIK